MDYRDLKATTCEANMQLPQSGLVDLTFGNVSVFDPALGAFAIKPSGVDYDKLTPDAMVVLDLEGKVLEGDLRPSSDTPTHRFLYRAWGDHGVRAVVHTHSRKAVAFAQAAREVPALGTTHCDFFNGAVPVTRAMTEEEVADEYEWTTGAVIVERFSDLSPSEIPAVLVRNHGPFAWGDSAAHALESALALEIAADLALNTLALDPQAPEAPAYLREKHFYRKHGATAYYGQKG